MSTLFILHETAFGYGLFERIESDEIGQSLEGVTLAMQDLSKFSRVVKLQGFVPFKCAAEALQNINDLSEGVVSDTLRSFLELNLIKDKKDKKEKKSKKSSFSLGVSDKTLASTIKSELGYDCVCDEVTQELIRGLRLFAGTLLKEFKQEDLEKAQLGLGHSYSRCKVKFNVHRSDNMIIQSSALLDQLDKDINTFAMRMREWYGWHFPELARIISDNKTFAKVVLKLPNKGMICEDAEDGSWTANQSLKEVEECLDGDVATAKTIQDAAKVSMGTDINPIDMINIKSFSQRVLGLSEYRTKLNEYLQNKMNIVAPNLSALIGDQVGARLISQAGSLTNLSKFPASTVQILGAEKALFRALKSKSGKTPKYGLIYHSSFIGKAGLKNKGRISRYLANKCSIASRIDCFSEQPTRLFGDALRSQVEERLQFYEKGTQPRKNIDVMEKVISDISKLNPPAPVEEKSKKDKKDKKEKKEKKSKSDSKIDSPIKKEKKEKEEKKEKKKSKK